MVRGKIWIGIAAIWGMGAFAATGQPVLLRKQGIEATLPKWELPGAVMGEGPFLRNIPEKVFVESNQPPYFSKWGWSLASLEEHPTKPAFEAVLVQDMSFGDFRVGAGEGGISLDPSGAIQTRGSVAVLNRRMRPAVFQISTDSMRLLEVRLPAFFHLQSGSGIQALVVRPFTEYGSGRFLIALRPRPYLNILRIGGELTVLPLAEKGQAGIFSSDFRIEFFPLH